MLSRLKARVLLSQCVGDEIWSPELCRQHGVPEAWIEELADAHESGFRSDRDTIYEQDRMVNQYHGVPDRLLAYKLAELLGVDTQRAAGLALGRRAEVQALKEAVEEL